MCLPELHTNEIKDRSYFIPELVVFHGETPGEILQSIDHVLQDPKLKNEQFGVIKKLSYESQAVFSSLSTHPAFRAALTAYGETELLKKLTQMRKFIADQPHTPFSHPSIGLFYGMGDPCGKIGCLFPGQGAQYIGMGGALLSIFPEAKRTWLELGDLSFDGQTIRDIVFPPESSENPKTDSQRLAGLEWTNPAIAVAGEAIFRMLIKMGVQPHAVAAHSFGDISALRAAGILSAHDMVTASRRRGEMGVNCSLATSGCLLVVSETVERIQDVLTRHNLRDVWIANYNTPTQTVITGIKEAISSTQKALKLEGINARPIPVSIGPHCPLSVNLAEQFSDYLDTLTFKPALCDVYSPVFGRKIKDNTPALFKKLLRVQIEKPVRFMNQIKTMYDDGIRIFIEVAPSDILTNMTREILADKPHIAIRTDQRKDDSLLIFMNSVAELFKEGLVKDFQVLWEGYTIPSVMPDDDELSSHKADNIRHLKKLDLEFARMKRSDNLRKAV